MKKTLLILLPAFALASCAQQQLAKADKDHARMAYAKAAEGYERVLPKITDRDAALRAADAYQRMNMNAKAADWYAFASRLQPLGTDDALRYAQVLQSLDRTPQALQQFDRVLAQRPEDAMVQALRNAAAEKNTFYLDTTLFSVVPVELPGMVSVFAATKYGNGIVFAGETEAPLEKRNPWTGNSFLDLYSASPSDNGPWGPPKALPGAVNGRFHDGPATFSADERTMYFTRSDYYKFRLNKDGSAVSHLMLYPGRPRTIKATGATSINSPTTVMNSQHRPCGTQRRWPDTLLHKRHARRSGWNGYLPQCVAREDGELRRIWERTMNTARQRDVPHTCTATLFTSRSNGHRSLGWAGHLRNHADGDDGWSTPENLNYPINTSYTTTSHSSPVERMVRGFLSSNRLRKRSHLHSSPQNDPTLAVDRHLQER
jgi:peptidoglycan-associated lipoprotein